jgi:S1-C subfamily serine protease
VGSRLHVRVGSLERVFDASHEPITIGTRDDATMRVADAAVEPLHVRVTFDMGWLVEDLSHGGAFLGPTRVERVEVDGDVRIALGSRDGVQVAIAPLLEDGLALPEVAPLDLAVLSGDRAGQRFPIRNGLTLGRDMRSDVHLPEREVSRLHARVAWRPGVTPFIEDAGSKHGTFLNGTRLRGACSLRAGDVVQIGGTRFDVRERDRIPPPAAEPALAVARTAVPAPRPSSMLRLREELSSLRRQRASRWPLALTAAGTVLAAVVATVAVILVFRPPSVADIVASAEPSTVLVSGLVGSELVGSGTGWVVDADEGLIVTNHHVVNGFDGFGVDLAGTRREAELVAAAACDDVALLRVSNRNEMVTMPLGVQDDLRRGDSVVAVGYPTSLGPEDTLVATAGVVSVPQTAVAVGGSFPNMVQTDAAINPGNSGGPLISMDHELVGMNTLIAVDAQNQGYAIGVDHVRELLPDLRAGRSSDWGGIHYVELDPLEASEMGLDSSLIVDGAFPGSPADDAGFGTGTWLVTAVNGVTLDIEDPWGSYCSALDELPADSPAALTVRPIEGSLESSSPELGEPQVVELSLGGA